MASFATASFTGADNAELSTVDGNWTKHGSYSQNIIIASNRASNQGSNISSLYYHSNDPVSADYTVEADVYINSVTLGPATGVCGRVSTGANTFYIARYGNNASNQSVLQLYKFVAGTATQLGSDVLTGYSAGQTKHLKLVLSGSTISAYKDGSASPDISVTDTAITAKGKAGIRLFSASSSVRLDLDNFDANETSAGNPWYYYSQLGDE